jgi:hypothetical protein
MMVDPTAAAPANSVRRVQPLTIFPPNPPPTGRRDFRGANVIEISAFCYENPAMTGSRL